MPFADIRGAALFYTDTGGSDRPMLFVHGFSCDSHDWSWQLPHFEQTHRVIAADLRGHGRSSAPPDGYEIASHAADIADLIETCACGPVVAVGHSLGGCIVATLAVERPELVDAVVAVDPGHLIPDSVAPMFVTMAEAYATEDPGVVAARAFDLGSHTDETPPYLAVWHNRRAMGMPAHAARQTIAGLIGGPAPFALRENSEPYLRRLTRPILSFYIDPSRAAIASELFVAPSRTVCFEGSGHWLHQERPGEVNSLIDDWLEKISLG